MGNIHIKTLKRKSNKFREFKKREWKLVHLDHYGVEFNEEYWDEKHLLLEALEGKEIVGALTGDLMAGVLYIPELIIKQDHKGKGIGKALIDKAEKWVKDQNGHEIYLVTGHNWPAKGFYLKLGFELAANLPKHYSKTDFVLFRKFIT